MHDLRRWAATAIAATTIGVAVGTVAPAAASSETLLPAAGGTATHETAPGRIVIGWDPDAAPLERGAIRYRLGLDHDEPIIGVGAEVVEVPAHAVRSTIDALLDEPGVAYAEPDFVLESTTDDPGYPHLWGLHNSGQEGGVPDVDVDAPEAWSTTRGSRDVIVAVLDTGVDISHPDLAANIWRNTGEIAGNGVDDDGNGYVDDVNGWDFLDDDATVFDSPTGDQHGTHVAGTIAAVAGNGVGVAGVAPNVKIMPLKFLDANGGGVSSDAAAAVAYARANGATVLNASWGGGGGTGLRNAIAAATDLVVVAAAGNEGVDTDDPANTVYPAGWAADGHGIGNVVSVTSVGRTGARSSFGNSGATTVDVGAPGERIVSTVPGSAYAYMSGTSMAAPHAAGVAALVASVHPSATGSGIVDRVKAGAQPLSSLSALTTTGGLVNAVASLVAEAAEPTPTAPPPTPPTTPTTTAPPPVDPEPVTSDPAPPPYDGEGVRSLDHACPGVTSSGFVDVSDGSTHAAGVGCARAWGVYAGSPDGRFQPLDSLTRGQLASVLSRAVEQATGQPLAAGTDRFVDDDDSVHRVAIDKLAHAGIVAGLDATRYGPSVSVTRGQFATMLARTHRLLAGDLPSGGDAFADDDDSPHESAIDGLVGVGVVGGTTDGRFQPNAALSRAQSATMVARLLDALVEVAAAESPAT